MLVGGLIKSKEADIVRGSILRPDSVLTGATQRRCARLCPRLASCRVPTGSSCSPVVKPRPWSLPRLARPG